MSTKLVEETRKLQVTGGSTYIISLPKKWVVQSRVSKGTPLTIKEEENGSLSILPPELEKYDEEEALIKISHTESPESIIRKVIATYLVGYNLIHIQGDQQQLSSKQRNTIKTFTRNLLVGTEIVTDTSSELKLQVLLGYPELSVQSALRRMSIITASMHREAITALQSLHRQLAKDVMATDNEVDRFHLYIIRQLKMAIKNPTVLKEIGLTTPRDCLGFRLMTKTVERTADHAASIARNVVLLPKKLESSTLNSIKEMSDLAISSFEDSIEALFKRDFDLAERVIEKSKNITSLEKTTISISKEASIKGRGNIRLIIENVRRTAEYASDIAEIVLNLTVENKIVKLST
jgi:phosphate uptake regulator